MKTLLLLPAIWCLAIVQSAAIFGGQPLQLKQDLLELKQQTHSCLQMIDDPSDLHCLKELEEALADLRSEVDAIKAPEIVRDFLQVQVDLEIDRLQQERVALQRPLWTDTRTLNQLKSHVRAFLLPWQRKYQSKSEAWSKVRNLSSRDRQELVALAELPPGRDLDVATFQEFVWKILRDEVETRIREAEDFLFESAVPDRTFRQLEHYLDFAFYEEGLWSCRAGLAFELLYRKYCYDGERTTIEEFTRYIGLRRQEYWNMLWADFKQTELFVEDRSLADEAESHYKRSGHDASELESFIRRAAPRENALACLRLLIKPYLERADFGRARELAGSFAPLFEEPQNGWPANQQYGKLMRQLEQNQISGYRPLPAPLNTPDDERQFVFSRDGNYLTVWPANDRGSMRILVRENDLWRELPPKGFNYLNTYYFTPFVEGRGEGVLEERSKRDFIYHNDINDYFVRNDVRMVDFFLDLGLGIALFATNSDYLREEAETSMGEYRSPWLTSPELTDQFDLGSKAYHGRPFGNGNMDLYFCLTSDRGRSWSKPQLLATGINTRFCERSPSLSADGHTLYFASEGHGSLGGFDLFQVSVRLEGGQFKLNGPVLPVEGVNSSYDEWYYRPAPAPPSLPRRNSAYFSSNRSGNFELYELSEATGTHEPPDPDGSVQVLPDWPKDKLLVEVICDTFRNTHEIALKGMIPVRGRIFDSQKRLVQRAKITFFHENGLKAVPYEIDPRDQGRYVVHLEEGARYRIIVTATTVDGDEVEEFLQKYIDVCEKVSEDSYMHVDLQTSSIADLQQKLEPTGFDFFFDTNQHTYTISSMAVIMKYYRDHLEWMAENPDIKFLLVGCADERGTPADNLVLAGNRNHFVHSKLREWGFADWQLIQRTVGETTDLAGDDLERFSHLLPRRIFEMNSQEQAWQKNRRVLILFVD